MEKFTNNGIVYLVGAGPGDPELLTLKALSLLVRCDVVIYDALVNRAILQVVRIDAELIAIGAPRMPGRKSQREVEQLMIERARDGQEVVRLKGGDPFIFGRGGEEAMALQQAGIAWQVVPGISAGHAVPAYAGIPLTHREVASSVVFVTGHEHGGKNFSVDWDKLATAADTLVIFMGAQKLPEIVTVLLKAGRSSATPLAVIQNGTHHRQRVITATLATILQEIGKEAVQSPALVIVGEVVRLHGSLSWFPQVRRVAEPWLQSMGINDGIFSNVS